MAGGAPAGSGNCPSSCPSCLWHGQHARAGSPGFSCLGTPTRDLKPGPGSALDTRNIPGSTMRPGVFLLLGLLILRAEPGTAPEEKGGEYQQAKPQLPGTGILGPAPCTPVPLSPCHVPSVPAWHMLVGTTSWPAPQPRCLRDPAPTLGCMGTCAYPAPPCAHPAPPCGYPAPCVHSSCRHPGVRQGRSRPCWAAPHQHWQTWIWDICAHGPQRLARL